MNYVSGSQTFLSAGAGNWLNKFRGTPASGDLQKKKRLCDSTRRCENGGELIFGDHHLSGQKSLEIA